MKTKLYPDDVRWLDEARKQDAGMENQLDKMPEHDRRKLLGMHLIQEKSGSPVLTLIGMRTLADHR